MFGPHQLIIWLLIAHFCCANVSDNDQSQQAVARLENLLHDIAHQHTTAQALFRQRFFAVGQSIGLIISDIGILGNIRWILARIESSTRDYWNDMWRSLCELNASAESATKRRFDELIAVLEASESDAKSKVYPQELLLAMRDTIESYSRDTEARLARFLPRVFGEMQANIDEVRRLHRSAIADRAVDRQPSFVKQFQCGFSVILQTDANFWSASAALLHGSCNRIRALLDAFLREMS